MKKKYIDKDLRSKYSDILSKLNGRDSKDVKESRRKEVLELNSTIEGCVPGKVLTFEQVDGPADYLLIEYGDDICYVQYLSEICDNMSPAVTFDNRIFTSTVILMLDRETTQRRSNC